MFFIIQPINNETNFTAKNKEVMQRLQDLGRLFAIYVQMIDNTGFMTIYGHRVICVLHSNAGFLLDRNESSDARQNCITPYGFSIKE